MPSGNESKEDYLERARAAAEQLVRQRYLLAEDLEPILARAARLWDLFVGAAPAAPSQIGRAHV